MFQYGVQRGPDGTWTVTCQGRPLFAGCQSVDGALALACGSAAADAEAYRAQFLGQFVGMREAAVRLLNEVGKGTAVDADWVELAEAVNGTFPVSRLITEVVLKAQEARAHDNRSMAELAEAVRSLCAAGVVADQRAGQRGKKGC